MAYVRNTTTQEYPDITKYRLKRTKCDVHTIFRSGVRAAISKPLSSKRVYFRERKESDGAALHAPAFTVPDGAAHHFSGKLIDHTEI